jgi:hypothetical protein
MLSHGLSGNSIATGYGLIPARCKILFIFVGCILLRYLHILYKHIIQNYIYVIRKRN